MVDAIEPKSESAHRYYTLESRVASSTRCLRFLLLQANVGHDNRSISQLTIGFVSDSVPYVPLILFQFQCLAQCHVVLGLIIFILASLADYVSSRINTVRLVGLEECCSFYFIMTGLHAAIIFVPSIIIVSSFDIHFYQVRFIESVSFFSFKDNHI
uniref:G-protein coupled receptors family 1 profile domain-containing protein n=1 Tax=Parascaris equorum TaxID=6256 RepID=A0A914R9I5_PAREQ